MTLDFHQYGSDRLVATLELDEAHSSIIDKLNEPTRLSATLTSDTAPTLQLGARTTYEGVTYYVTKEPTIRKEHSKLYVIETELETVIGLARHVILDNPVDKRSSFDYTASATEHIQLVVDSLNGKKLSKVPAWTRGLILASNTVKHIKYDGISAWDALQQIRQTYETDLHIDGTAIALGIWGNKTKAIELAYGKDNGILSGLERIKHDDTPTPMSLYVTGTKRNMTKGRLTMQTLETLKVDNNGTIYHGSNPDIEGRLYGTDKTGQYISEFAHDNGTQPLYTEATYTNEEIYPSHVSTIRSVTKVKDHFEVNSDFDYDKFRIDGEQMQVVFQSGNLAGREFDAKYYTGTDRLAIVPKEEDDTTLPNDTLCPKVGDQYIVTGIKLPDKYITDAQRKLTEAALRHLLKLQQQRYSYKAEIDPVYLHNHKTTIGTKLDVGQYVHLTDQQIAVGDPYIRIIAKRTYLDRPYTPEIELSNEVERLSLLDHLVRDVDGMRIDTEEMRDRLRNNDMALDSLVVTSTDISERLATAEEALTGKLNQQAQTLSSQGTRLATAESSIESQGTRLGTAESNIKSHGTTLSGYGTRITNAETALTSQGSSIKTITDWKDDIDKIGKLASSAELENLRTLLNKEVSHWTEDKAPIPLNDYVPADQIKGSDQPWGKNEDPERHIGDLCTVIGEGQSDKGTSYRFTKNPSADSYKWLKVIDNDGVLALSKQTKFEKAYKEFEKAYNLRQTDIDNALDNKQPKGNYIEKPDFDRNNTRVEGEINNLKRTYQVRVTTKGEIRNGVIVNGTSQNGTDAILHTAHVYDILGNKVTSLDSKLTWTINKNRTTDPKQRTVTGATCYITASDFVRTVVSSGTAPCYYDIELNSSF